MNPHQWNCDCLLCHFPLSFRVFNFEEFRKSDFAFQTFPFDRQLTETKRSDLENRLSPWHMQGWLKMLGVLCFDKMMRFSYTLMWSRPFGPHTWSSSKTCSWEDHSYLSFSSNFYFKIGIPHPVDEDSPPSEAGISDN